MGVTNQERTRPDGLDPINEWQQSSVDVALALMFSGPAFMLG